MSSMQEKRVKALTQVRTAALMQVASASFDTETEIASVSTLLRPWEPDTEYAQGDALSHDGKTWRVSQNHTSQAIYPPGTTESLYYEIQIADDGVIVYRECHGEYDMVRKGELRHFPTASDPVYRALADTAYSPTSVPANWELVEE